MILLCDGRWVKVDTVPAPQLKVAISDVEVMQEYQFQIIAANKAGPGEPSLPSESILIKPKHGNEVL